jgi:hypothetical protein
MPTLTQDPEHKKLLKEAREARRAANELAQSARNDTSSLAIINLEPAQDGNDPEPIDPARLDTWARKDREASAAEAALRAYMRGEGAVTEEP